MGYLVPMVFHTLTNIHMRTLTARLLSAWWLSIHCQTAS